VQPDEPQDLEPPLRARELPDEVRALREEADAETAQGDAETAIWFDAHLTVYEHVVRELIDMHRGLADDTDLEIGADTRWSAVWELSGRCLAISNVVVHDCRGGFASEAVGTLRSLHEAVQLLNAVAFHGDETLVRRWLRGDYTPPREARDVQTQQQALALERMQELGIEPGGGDVAALGRQIYSTLSEASHHQRSVMRECVAPALRQFAYGPHPQASTRAGHVGFVGTLLEEVVLVIGGVFVDLLGREFYDRNFTPLLESIRLVQHQYPGPED
jgi:hypothetical protein